MDVTSASITIACNNVVECEQFYRKHFAAKPIFDCGWYKVLRLAGSQTPQAEICFMEPRDGVTTYQSGLVFNLEVNSADVEHDRLTEQGLEIVLPLEDHPWGDRGFAVFDPAGVMVYCYQHIEPDEEFAAYYLS